MTLLLNRLDLARNCGHQRIMPDPGTDTKQQEAQPGVRRRPTRSSPSAATTTSTTPNPTISQGDRPVGGDDAAPVVGSGEADGVASGGTSAVSAPTRLTMP